MRQVFNKEENRFELEFDVLIQVDMDFDSFLGSLMTFCDADKLLETQVENENFEAAGKIRDYIKSHVSLT